MWYCLDWYIPLVAVMGLNYCDPIVTKLVSMALRNDFHCIRMVKSVVNIEFVQLESIAVELCPNRLVGVPNVPSDLCPIECQRMGWMPGIEILLWLHARNRHEIYRNRRHDLLINVADVSIYVNDVRSILEIRKKTKISHWINFWNRLINRRWKVTFNRNFFFESSKQQLTLIELIFT